MQALALPVARGAGAAPESFLATQLFIDTERAWDAAAGRDGRSRFTKACDDAAAAVAACEDGVARIVGGDRRAELAAAVKELRDGLTALLVAAGGARLPLTVVTEALTRLTGRINGDLLRGTPELGHVVADFDRAVAGLEHDIAAEEVRAAGSGGGALDASEEVNELEAMNNAKARVRDKKVAIAEQHALRIVAVSKARATYERVGGMSQATATEGVRLAEQLAAVEPGLIARLEGAVLVRCARARAGSCRDGGRRRRTRPRL